VTRPIQAKRGDVLFFVVLFFACIGSPYFGMLPTVPNESGLRIPKPNYRKEIYAPRI
jgi:hypothetical protein